MLNKEVCKRCINEVESKRSPAMQMMWSDKDEARWLEGRLYCGVVVNSFLPVDGSVPHDCKYILEHLILGQTNPEGNPKC